MKSLKQTTIILSLLVSSFYGIGQNNGFIGKKNILSVDGRFFIPILYNMRGDAPYENKSNGETFTSARNLFSKGVNVTLGRTLSNKVAFLLQGSILQSKLYGAYSFTVLDPVTQTKSIVNLRSTYFISSATGIMPILEFAGGGGILPVGLSHQIGLGFYKHKMVEKDYLVLGSDYNTIGSTYYRSDDIIDYENTQANSYSLMYKMNFRLPITRSLLWNFGIRYNLNITKDTNLDIYGKPSDKLISNAGYRSMVQSNQLNNFISLETGISFAF